LSSLRKRAGNRGSDKKGGDKKDAETKTGNEMRRGKRNARNLRRRCRTLFENRKQSFCAQKTFSRMHWHLETKKRTPNLVISPRSRRAFKRQAP